MKTILTNLDSSLLEEVSYDNTDEVLEIKFLHSEAIYVYQNVDEKDFEDLRNADSLGSHFAKNIRNGYEFEKREVERNSREIPGFEGTLEKLDNLTIRPSNEDK